MRRDQRSRAPRLTTLTAAAAFAIVLVAGASPAPATAASGARPGYGRCPPATRDDVTAAWLAVFARNQPTPAGDRAARLAGADDPALRAVLDDWLADPAGASSSVTVTRVRCRGRNRALVDGDLVLAGVTLAKVLAPGQAVREQGTWKVARSTFCSRVILEDPGRATSGACAS